MKTQHEEHASPTPSQHPPTKSRSASASKRLLGAAVPFALAAGLCASVALAWGDDDDHKGGGAVKLLTTIPIPNITMKTFDISWVDPGTRRYFLADRSNKAIDVIDTRTNTFLDQIHANPPFAGATGNNDTSGPNGVVVSGHWLFATDFPSRVVTIDLDTKQTVADLN